MNRIVVSQLRKRAVQDQYHAALEDFFSCDDGQRRAQLIAALVRHEPTGMDRERYEELRMEWQHAHNADLTTSDIAKMSGLTVEGIRAMAERGEMPAPRYRGRWRWWWDRQDITEWLARCDRGAAD